MRQGWAQARAERLMRTTLQISRSTTGGDGMGGQTPGTPAVIATVAGNIRPAGRTPDEQAVAERLAGRSIWTVDVPVGADVQSGDRLIEPSSGRSFEVVKPLAATLAAMLPIVCVEE